MSPTLLRLAAELLDLAADDFRHHGCNDFKMTGRLTEPKAGPAQDDGNTPPTT